MNQVPVKWVHSARLQNEKRQILDVRVIEISALRKVVEGLKKQYRGEACYIYTEALTDLLTGLGEVGE